MITESIKSEMKIETSMLVLKIPEYYNVMF